MSWYILGIDLGRTGFACLKQVGSNHVVCAPTPMTSPPVLRNVLSAESEVNVEDYDIEGMLRITKAAAKKADNLIVAVMEQPFFRKTSNQAVVDLFRAQAYWAAVCRLAGINAFYIDSTSWKARVGLTKRLNESPIAKKDKSKRSEIGKALAMQIANELVGWNMFLSHDAADSFLIAYCAEHFYDEKFGFLKRPVS